MTKVWRTLGSVRLYFGISAPVSLVQHFQHRLCALILMRHSRVLYIYTNTSVLRVTKRSGIAAFWPGYHTVLHICVKLPSLGCRKIENVNGLRFRWVRARGPIFRTRFHSSQTQQQHFCAATGWPNSYINPLTTKNETHVFL